MVFPDAVSNLPPLDRYQCPEIITGGCLDNDGYRLLCESGLTARTIDQLLYFTGVESATRSGAGKPCEPIRNPGENYTAQFVSHFTDCRCLIVCFSYPISSHF